MTDEQPKDGDIVQDDEQTPPLVDNEPVEENA